jgi:hypothetical protein
VREARGSPAAYLAQFQDDKILHRQKPCFPSFLWWKVRGGLQIGPWNLESVHNSIHGGASGIRSFGQPSGFARDIDAPNLYILFQAVLSPLSRM